MHDELAALLERKLLIVTGKGGAGKSTLSLALAHRLACLKKRVWLVEIGRKRDLAFSRLPELVGKKNLEHKPTEVKLPGCQEKILVSVLNPAVSLAEYVDLKLPTGGLASILLNNRVTASFLEVVPGLPDLVALGKLWHSLTSGDRGNPDVIVLDAPATGHALSLLHAPGNFRRITGIGPIYRDASQMEEFLSDKKLTGIVLASVPEEMSIQETIELQRLLAKDFPLPFLIVNKCFPLLPEFKEQNLDSTLWKAYSYSRARGLRENAAISSLKRVHQLPFLFPDPDSPPQFLRLSGLLA